MHNLYGAYEVKATAEALRAIRNKRQFIFTRCGQRLARGRCVHDSTLSQCACLGIACCCHSAMSVDWLDAIGCTSIIVSASQQHPPQAFGPALYPSHAWGFTIVRAVTKSVNEGMRRQLLLNSFPQSILHCIGIHCAIKS